MRANTPPESNPDRRRGTVAVFTAISLLVIFGFTAIAVDAGYLYHLYAEMQRTVDAAALAGAHGLQYGEGTVDSFVEEFAAKNAVNHVGVGVGELTIEIGNWDDTARQFHPTNSWNRFVPNAVRVNGHRDNVSLFFAPLLGVDTSRVIKHAVALRSNAVCGGIWGTEGISAEGGIVTDSYNSNEGVYGTNTPYQNGDLCSCRDVNLYGSVDIHGDVMHGFDYDTYIDGSSYSISGIQGEHSCDNVLTPPFDISEAAANNDNAQIGTTNRGRDPFAGSPYNLYVTGNDGLTLAPGNYYFNSAYIDGQAPITVSGPTVFYVDGDATFTGGGFVNTTNDPKDLVIYCTGTTVTLTGNAGFVGTLIAPNATVLLPGTGDYYGWIFGRFIDIQGDAVVHVDEAVVQQFLPGAGIGPILVE